MPIVRSSTWPDCAWPGSAGAGATRRDPNKTPTRGRPAGARGRPPPRGGGPADGGRGGREASTFTLRSDEVVAALGMRGGGGLGLQPTRLDSIVGPVDSPRDFDRRFRPTTGRVRERWERLALAQRRGEPIPPIDVFRVGDLHFVQDGHHRVSIAMATGATTIDAYVTEVLTVVPPAGLPRPPGTV